MITQPLISEFGRETGLARKVLDRIPDEQMLWKPHPKSWSLGGLGTHLTTVAQWGILALTEDRYDMAPGGQVIRTEEARTASELMAGWDDKVERVRTALASATAERMEEPWTLERNGAPVLTLSRHEVMRTWVMNHLVHHRGQLTVYLRLIDISVPAIYGPSADER